MLRRPRTGLPRRSARGIVFNLMLITLLPLAGLTIMGVSMIRDALGRSDGAERIEHATGDVEQVVQVISAVGDERTTASIIARAEVMGVDRRLAGAVIGIDLAHGLATLGRRSDVLLVPYVGDRRIAGAVAAMRKDRAAIDAGRRIDPGRVDADYRALSELLSDRAQLEALRLQIVLDRGIGNAAVGRGVGVLTPIVAGARDYLVEFDAYFRVLTATGAARELARTEMVEARAMRRAELDEALGRAGTDTASPRCSCASATTRRRGPSSAPSRRSRTSSRTTPRSRTGRASSA